MFPTFSLPARKRDLCLRCENVWRLGEGEWNDLKWNLSKASRISLETCQRARITIWIFASRWSCRPSPQRAMIRILICVKSTGRTKGENSKINFHGGFLRPSPGLIANFATSAPDGFWSFNYRKRSWRKKRSWVESRGRRERKNQDLVMR